MTAARTEQQDVDVTGITAAEIATFHGDVIIETGTAPARLAVVLVGNATYTIERIGTLLYVIGKKSGKTYGDNSVNLHVRLPAGLALKLATVCGTIQVQGDVKSLEATSTKGAITTVATGAGSLRLTAVVGSIAIQGANGAIRAITSLGDVHLADADGQIEIAIASGHMRLSRVNGMIKATTGNGEMQFTDISGQLQATSGNGGMRLERVTLDPGTKNWVKTGNGALDVQGLSAPGGLHIQARGYTGPFRADLAGYVIQVDRHHLQARLAGAHPAHLELATSKEILISTKMASS